mgnify:CR=1 FL=1
MAEPVLKIQGIRYILTMDSERRIIQGGTIIVEDQRISQVGKAAELASVSADRVIDARNMVVTPGFCNGHMHIATPTPLGESSPTTWARPTCRMCSNSSRS